MVGQTELTNSRELGIDFLRILSMFMVVILHVLGRGGILDHTRWMSGQYVTSWFWEVIAFCAVNCFALISGYVGVISKFRWSRILSLWFQVVFYTLGITMIFEFYMPETTGLIAWMQAIFPITTRPYWYITSYVGMFIFIQFMNIILERTSRKAMELFLILVLIFFCLLPCILQQSPYGFAGGYSMAWLLILYLAGGYIQKYNIPKLITRKRALIIFLVSTILTLLSKFAIVNVIYKISGRIVEGGNFISYLSPFIIVNAVALLCLFANTKFKSHSMQKIISILSPATLGVYIIHENPLIRNHLIVDAFSSLAQSNPFVLTAGVFISAIGIYAICSLIEIMRIKLFEILRVKVICQKFDSLMERFATSK